MERAFRLTLVVVLALLSAVPALAATFGTDPIPVSVGPSGQAANAPSGSAAISGDNRTARYVAFHSNGSSVGGGDSLRKCAWQAANSSLSEPKLL